MAKMAIIGSGHVGLVTGACFAKLGHSVICVDNDAEKIASLKKGALPFYEPGLARLVRQGVRQKKLSFSTEIGAGVQFAQIIFISVNTPPKENGEADLSNVEFVAREIAKNLTSYRLIVEKSTVPVETGGWVKKTILQNLKKKEIPFDVASNPEFLREGTAVRDFLKPDRIVLGVETDRAKRILLGIYKRIKAPFVITDLKSAEVIKHASNSFLALKISFINMVSRLCEKMGADIQQVSCGIGLDPRIGKTFLSAGVGFGGFCFPKDLAAFIRIGEKAGCDFGLLKEVLKINEEQKKHFVDLVEKNLWNLKNKTVAVLGLSFKPDTDDMRFAPSLDIIRELTERGVSVRAFDPKANEVARSLLNGVNYCEDAYQAAEGADALLIVTEWEEFKKLDLLRLKHKLRQPMVIDGRNLYDPERMRSLGFHYVSIGRARE